MERPPLRYLKPTPGKTFRTLNEAEIEATVKNNLTLAAALLANQPVDPEVWKPAAVAIAPPPPPPPPPVVHDEDGPLPTAPPPAYHEDRAGDVDEECWASPPRRRYDPDAYYDAKAAVTTTDVDNLGRGVAAALRYSTDAARQSLEATDDLRRRIAELELTVANRLEDEAPPPAKPSRLRVHRPPPSRRVRAARVGHIRQHGTDGGGAERGPGRRGPPRLDGPAPGPRRVLRVVLGPLRAGPRVAGRRRGRGPAGPPIDSPDGQCSIAPSYETDDEQMPSPGAIKRTKGRARARATVNARGAARPRWPQGRGAARGRPPARAAVGAE